MNIPGTINDNPQSDSTNALASKVPMIFPIDVWEFQIPNINPKINYTWINLEIIRVNQCLFFFIPRFPLPNQFPIAVTTPGHPVVWTIPPNI